MQSFQNNIWAVLFVAGAIQGYFLSIVLFSMDRGRKAANICLGLLIFSYSLLLTKFIMYNSGLFPELPNFLPYSDFLWYLLGPLFYFYIKLLLSIPINVGLKDVVHIIPALIMLAIALPFDILDGETQLTLINRRWPYFKSYFVYTMYLVQVPTYLLLSVRIIKNYEVSYKNSESFPALIHVGWLRNLFLIMIAPVIHDFISFIYQITENTIVIELNFSVYTFYTLVIHSLAFLVIRQPDKIFPALANSENKYKTSALSESERKARLENLHILMHEEKPFLEPYLKRSDLAKMLSISSHHLSQFYKLKHRLNL